MNPPTSAVEALKSKGNALFGQGEYVRAAGEYSKAIKLVEREAAGSNSSDSFASWFPFFASANSNNLNSQPEKRRSSATTSTTTTTQPRPFSDPSAALRPRSSEALKAPTKLSFAELLERDRAITQSSNSKHASQVEEASHETDLLASLYSNRALCYTSNKQFDLAWLDANTVLKLRPNWIKGYFRRAEVFLRTRRFEDALQDYEAALQREPGNHSILDKIARTKIHLADTSQGLLLDQISVARGDICTTKSPFLLAPIQTLLFQFAQQMRNFVYLVGDISSRQVVVVDACWDIDGILARARELDVTIVAAVVTHYHVDHAGGIPPPPYDKYNIRVDGLAKILKRLPKTVKGWIHGNDIPGLLAANPEISRDRLKPTTDGELLTLPLAAEGGDGNESIGPTVASKQRTTTTLRFIHTPGHTPGSQCILVNGCRLLSGDTLFIQSCGRCDFPDSSPKDLGESLEKLGKLQDSVVVHPGHDYGGEWTSVGRERVSGLLNPIRRKSFLANHDGHAHKNHRDHEEDGGNCEEEPQLGNKM